MQNLSVSALLVLLLSCSAQVPHYGTNGHYESQTAAQAEAIAKKGPTAIPEYYQTGTVIISAELLMDPHVVDDESIGYGQSEIAKALVATGTQVVVITPKGFDPDSYPHFEAMNHSFGGTYDSLKFVESAGATPSVWARDWAPIQALDTKGHSVLLDFNYHTDRPFGDDTPRILSEFFPTSQRLSVPVYTEGGNFMINGRGDCLMTDAVVEFNEKPEIFYLGDEHQNPIFDDSGELVEARGPVPPSRRRGTVYYDLNNTQKIRVNDIYLNRSQIVDFYKSRVGCKEVIILPRMPHEGTGHIDLWAKFMSDDEILVSNIEDSQLKLVRGKERRAAREIQRFLNQQQKELINLGYRLTLIPMPLPSLEIYEYDDGTIEEEFIVRSYTNSLLVQKNGDQDVTKTALVPQFKLNTFIGPEGLDQVPYMDESLLPSYETQVATAYQSFGYSVVFLPSDDLISMGGAIHCVTMQTNKPLF